MESNQQPDFHDAIDDIVSKQLSFVLNGHGLVYVSHLRCRTPSPKSAGTVGTWAALAFFSLVRFCNRKQTSTSHVRGRSDEGDRCKACRGEQGTEKGIGRDKDRMDGKRSVWRHASICSKCAHAGPSWR